MLGHFERDAGAAGDGGGVRIKGKGGGWGEEYTYRRAAWPCCFRLGLRVGWLIVDVVDAFRRKTIQRCEDDSTRYNSPFGLLKFPVV